MAMKIRLRGLVLIVVGVGLFLGLYALLSGGMYAPGRGYNNKALKVAAWPLVLAVVGAIELVSGCRFSQVAAKWDGMPVLTRLLLGLVIITASIPLIVLIFAAFAAAM
jgi:hypothetical protein